MHSCLKWSLLVLACLVIFGCTPRSAKSPDSQPAPPSSATEKDTPMQRNKTPQPLPSFVEGPSILPTSDLLVYFEKQAVSENGKRVLFKVPVVMVMRDDFPGAVREAYIGVSEDLPEEDRLILDIDDSGMGIGLSDRIGSLCPGQSTCRAWLIGNWGALLEGLDLGGDDSGHAFAMRDLMAMTDAPPSNSEAHIWVAE